MGAFLARRRCRSWRFLRKTGSRRTLLIFGKVLTFHLPCPVTVAAVAEVLPSDARILRVLKRWAPNVTATTGGSRKSGQKAKMTALAKPQAAAALGSAASLRKNYLETLNLGERLH